VPGFLKGEFLDHLKNLPKWKKTKYYCSSYRLLKCKAREIKTPGEFKFGFNNPAASKKNRSPRKKTPENFGRLVQEIGRGDNFYNLGRYEIIEKNNGQLFWKTYSSLSRTKTGKCYINGGILFIGPPEAEKAGPVKKQFMLRLAGQPVWKRTNYYCPIFALYHSETGAICRSFEEGKTQEKHRNHNIDAIKESFNRTTKFKAPVAANTIPEVCLKAVFCFCKEAGLTILILSLWSGKTVYRITKWVLDKWVGFRD
jgi:hypothetical protein